MGVGRIESSLESREESVRVSVPLRGVAREGVLATEWAVRTVAGVPCAVPEEGKGGWTTASSERGEKLEGGRDGWEAVLREEPRWRNVLECSDAARIS